MREVGMPTTTLQQFQIYVWESLPVRKVMVGKDVIDDIVTIIVQQWPAEELSERARNSEQETELMLALIWDVRRMAALLYGDVRFDALLNSGLSTLIPAAVEVTRVWWRHRKTNRAKVGIWRRKWSN